MPSEGDQQRKGRGAAKGDCTTEDCRRAEAVANTGIGGPYGGAVTPAKMVGGRRQCVGNRAGRLGELVVVLGTLRASREMGALIREFVGFGGPQPQQLVFVKTGFHRSLRRASRKRRVARKS